MIRVTFYKNKDLEPIGFDVAGHAAYNVPGKDIVCAGISALSQSAEIFIKTVLEEHEVASPNVNGITICFETTNHTKHYQASAAISVFEVGAKAIAEQFPQNVEVKELNDCEFNFETNSSKFTFK